MSNHIWVIHFKGEYGEDYPFRQDEESTYDCGYATIATDSIEDALSKFRTKIDQRQYKTILIYKCVDWSSLNIPGEEIVNEDLSYSIEQARNSTDSSVVFLNVVGSGIIDDEQ